MFTRRFVLSACAVVVVALAATASTQAWSSLARTNHLTFSGAVALPGVVLPAGSYTFEAGPEDSDSAIVRVLTRDRRQVMYTGFTTPVSRPAASERPVVTFGEAPKGQAMPIAAWYPAHSRIGHRFRY